MVHGLRQCTCILLHVLHVYTVRGQGVLQSAGALKQEASTFRDATQKTYWQKINLVEDEAGNVRLEQIINDDVIDNSGTCRGHYVSSLALSVLIVSMFKIDLHYAHKTGQW